MTGEITLQGHVLPVGGIREKCLAAVRNNIKRVILPIQNKPDAEDLSDEIKKNIEIIFAYSIKDVIRNAFDSDVLDHDFNLNLLRTTPKF